MAFLRLCFLFLAMLFVASPGESAGENSLPPFPSLDEFLKGSQDSLTGDFKINDQCKATVTVADTLYQMSSDPADCVNLAALLDFITPEDKGHFNMGSGGFVNLESIIIRSLSFNTNTKDVSIAASYSDSVDLIPETISISNIRLELSFTSSHTEKWTFHISASLTIGTVTIEVTIFRNDKGYYLSASSSDSISLTDIANQFKVSDSLLPENGLKSELAEANFDSFAIKSPRIKAVFTEGYGFMLGGEIRILNWEPFEVNVLLNNPNDASMSVTIAVYISDFSISKMFDDLFQVDISSVPVIGAAQVRNLALCLSTRDVQTPLTLLDIGYSGIFELPYQRGAKVSFEVLILDVYVTLSILITPLQLRLTMSQGGDLTLRKVIGAFLAEDSTDLVSGTTENTTLDDWPEFISFDPLAISVSLLDIQATKSSGAAWEMTKLEINLKMTEPIKFFNNIITISDLVFEMTWTKSNGSSQKSGLISGMISLGSGQVKSPKVAIRIPYPFANEEIVFTFTDFSIYNVANALGFTLPRESFAEILAQIQLDHITLAFSDRGQLNNISVQASIPEAWPIYGTFSIGDLTIIVEIVNVATSNDRTWVFRVNGHIMISSCDISIATQLGSEAIEFSGRGTNCDVSIGDLLAAVSSNPVSFPDLISGFTLSEPVFSFLYNRETQRRSIGFGATTNLFGSSDTEVAFVSSGTESSIVAGFAVQSASSISEIIFVSELGLTDLVVIYISNPITLSPYQWGKAVFQEYAPAEEEQARGLTIYAKFTPNENNLMGKLLREANQSSIVVKLTLPNLIFELEIELGDGIPLGDSNGKFVSMGLIISKQLIGLRLKFSLTLDATTLFFTGELQVTFATASVTISLLMEGEWKEPLGIKNFMITRLGLRLGISLATLLPDIGLSGGIRVSPPGRNNISADVTLCVNTANPSTTVFEIHFTRLLLADIVNLFAGREVDIPEKIGETGFPDEVRIFFSPAGNDQCFSKSYEAGVEIHGTFQIPFLQVYARADIVLKLTPFQLKANLSLRPINYGSGVLKIVSARNDDDGPYLKMNIGNSDEFLINGSCKVVLFGASASVLLVINKKKLLFEGRLNLWNLFQVYLKVDLEYSATNPKLHVIGEMQNDLFTKIKQRASQGIRNGASRINRDISAAQQKIRNAQTDVYSIRRSIRYHERIISEEVRSCRRAPWYKKYICIRTAAKLAYHGAILAGLYTGYGIAIGVLEAANWFLEGVKGAISIGADVLATLVYAAFSIIDIKYVRFDICLTSVTKTFQFECQVQILAWTFEPSFSISFSSASSAERGINAAGDKISKSTVDKIK